ncbi:MAG: GDP-L-fucose synthase [Deltaproteobacteria bacterium]|nr:MAG: GDP-L-fucose synthase [Deltaproteobacteria bacterium]
MTQSNSPVLPKSAAIYVAGHHGMVGSAIVRRLQAEGYSRIITRTHPELDLIDQRAVKEFFRGEKIDAVFMAAARVGGIHANNIYRADFIYENLMVECNVIQAAFEYGIERLLFLGSSCIYPRSCPQPMREEYLLSGYLEPTNEPYAIAKIAGIKLCESYNRQYGTHYRSVMPTNLYGPNDGFDLENSHVLPAMLRKFHLAKLAGQGDWEGIRRDEERFGPIPQDVREALPGMQLWGTGASRREFLHVDDMAAACVFVMQLSDKEYSHACAWGEVSYLNIGCGKDHTIRELAEIIRNAVGFEGCVAWDSSRPDGMPQKLLDLSRLSGLGWSPQIDLVDGIRITYDWYQTGALRNWKSINHTLAKTGHFKIV